ncbi:MAG: hypothetical protein SPL58_03000 [Bacteroidaceae bacterium]|nr:hypothetical protein [Bacteroidaceae bacterium]
MRKRSIKTWMRVSRHHNEQDEHQETDFGGNRSTDANQYATKFCLSQSISHIRAVFF